MLTQAKPLAQAGTADWLAAREHGLGASEVAAAVGLSPYMQPRRLYELKRGEVPPIEETPAMRLGKLLEPAVKAEFATRMLVSFADLLPPMFQHPDFDFIFATPDAIVDDGSLLECKTAGFRMAQYYGDEGSDFVPQHYVCQCQQQMAVMGADLCHLAVLFDGRTLRCYQIRRNEKLIGLLMAGAAEFWERVQTGNPPPVINGHGDTPELLKALFGSIRETRVELSKPACDAWLEYERLGKEASEIDKQRTALKSSVLLEIGEHGAGLLGDGRMVRRNRIDAKQISYLRESYVDARAVKVPKNDDAIIVAADPIEELIELESRKLLVGQILQDAGAVCREMSEAGSAYWRLPNGRDLRIADHPANRPTREWMERVDAAEIRVDFPEVNLAAAVAALLV